MISGGFAFEVQLSITEKGRYAVAYGLSCKKDCHELHTTDPRRTIPYPIPIPLKPNGKADLPNSASENPISSIRSSFNTSTPLSAANSAPNRYAPTCANTTGSHSITAPFTATSAKTKATAALCGNISEYAANPTANATAAHGPKEFYQHTKIANALNAGTYFCRPYHSWEKGLNENANGLIRQYFPKQTDFRNVSNREIRRVQDELNHRPRKTLGYETPSVLFLNLFQPLMPGCCT